jgi:branched-chain amino acid transport system ATP-binding protein
MLAIGRILRTGASLLLLDEPTEGLAPVIVQQIGRTIGKLKEMGFTIILVEQNFHFAATVGGPSLRCRAGSGHRQHQQRSA